jgi:hypothetical protein
MASQVAPKADQPRVSTESLKRSDSSPNMQYRVQGIKSFNRSPSTRSYGRSTRS